jgi:hypothetical protein
LTDRNDPINVSAAIATRTGKVFEGSGSRDPVKPVARATCDMCGAARARSDRQRFVWDTGFGTEVVLAELCRDCAGQADRLLEIYGGHGREAISVTRPDPVSIRETALGRTVRGIVLRGLVYMLVALAAFVVVTALTSRG